MTMQGMWKAYQAASRAQKVYRLQHGLGPLKKNKRRRIGLKFKPHPGRVWIQKGNSSN